MFVVFDVIVRKCIMCLILIKKKKKRLCSFRQLSNGIHGYLLLSENGFEISKSIAIRVLLRENGNRQSERCSTSGNLVDIFLKN